MRRGKGAVDHDSAAVLRSADSADGQIDVNIERINGSDAQVSAIELGEWSLGEPVLKDSDQDGMPDSFEMANARPALSGIRALNPNLNDATRDNDGAGMSNLAEYLAGTDPLDPADSLSMKEVAALAYGSHARTEFVFEPIRSADTTGALQNQGVVVSLSVNLSRTRFSATYFPSK